MTFAHALRGIVALIALLALAGCRKDLTEAQIRKQFTRGNPGCRIIEIEAATGNDRQAEVKILYTMSTNQTVFTDVWKLAPEGGWHVEEMVTDARRPEEQ